MRYQCENGGGCEANDAEKQIAKCKCGNGFVGENCEKGNVKGHS